jgi:hypothetical protein
MMILYDVEITLFDCMHALRLPLPWLQVESDKAARKGGAWPAEEEAAFRAKIVERYDNEGSPYFASARLWDDGERRGLPGW